MSTTYDWRLTQGLTRIEILMLIDIRPFSLVELIPLIEEAQDRYTDKELEKILDLIRDCFPFVRPVEDDDLE